MAVCASGLLRVTEIHIAAQLLYQPWENASLQRGTIAYLMSDSEEWELFDIYKEWIHLAGSLSHDKW